HELGAAVEEVAREQVADRRDDPRCAVAPLQPARALADGRVPVDERPFGDGGRTQRPLDTPAQLRVVEVAAKRVHVAGETVCGTDELPPLAVEVLRPDAVAGRVPRRDEQL